MLVVMRLNSNVCKNRKRIMCFTSVGSIHFSLFQISVFLVPALNIIGKTENGEVAEMAPVVSTSKLDEMTLHYQVVEFSIMSSGHFNFKRIIICSVGL